MSTVNADSHAFEVDWLLAQPGVQPTQHSAHIAIAGERIASLASTTPTGNGLIALPGLCNAHDHARAVRATALGGFDKPLESWLAYLGVIPGVDAYVCAASSLARSALRGAGRVMVHYTRQQGLVDPLMEAQQVAKAARDVGVQVGFAVAMRDRNNIAYGDDASVLAALPADLRARVSPRFGKPPLPAAEQLALADAIAESCHGPGFNVQYGPTGVQWCSDALLRAIAEASAQHNRQVHMHMLETRYQREWADHHLPQGIIRYLHDIGLLSPRLTLAHCTYCTPEELDLIAQSGARIAVNTGSNLGLRSGIAPVAQMLSAGCNVAMGLDGLSLDEDDDALRELRLLHHLHKGWGYETKLSHAQAWRIASEQGRHSISGVETSDAISVGGLADMLVLDGHSLMEDRLFDDVEILDYVLARATATHIKRVIVSGKTIVDNGHVLGVDYPALMTDLMARLRSALDPADKWRASVRALDGELAQLYHQHGGPMCC
ncbi:amidohydrolase family protein [Uliginosibacterium sp. H3]|uniref:Amidohydrolase family protein n=1 Tax=Uliginosibacterium silvisoli TaxID=3114758 RepID=A0ABU6JYW7_9RHOO|nr:amidohydrolase family protein [Uliginosibacterium sp. H3]